MKLLESVVMLKTDIVAMSRWSKKGQSTPVVSKSQCHRVGKLEQSFLNGYVKGSTVGFGGLAATDQLYPGSLQKV